MPAFSPFARGYDVCRRSTARDGNSAFKAAIQAYVATPTRVNPVGSLADAIERLSEIDASPPSRFRRFR